jgi:probable HAF family extracellular repeat protein
MNAHGAVVGYTLAGPTVPPAQHAFLWTSERGLTDLGTLGGKRSYATAIADDGTVVGYSQTAGSTVYHAFVWTTRTGMLDLGFTGEESQSLAVNASGWVVGYTGASSMGGPTGHAMLWQPRDVVPPTLVLPADITVDATSAAGAVVTYTVGATDNVDPSPGVGCTPASGSTFPIGDATVACEARDATGNVAFGTFAVHVRGAAEQLDMLVSAVRALRLPYGLENSLLVKLDAGELGAFVHEANAQADKAIASADAADLVARAERIDAVLAAARA